MMRPGDLLLITVCAALVGAAYWFAWQPAGSASAAVVRGVDEPGRRIPLDRERELTVAGPRGPSRIAVRPGGIRFLSSPCQGKHCIHSGWLEDAGDFAACLPNGVSVTLIGDKDGYDAIGY